MLSSWHATKKRCISKFGSHVLFTVETTLDINFFGLAGDAQKFDTFQENSLAGKCNGGSMALKGS